MFRVGHLNNLIANVWLEHWDSFENWYTWKEKCFYNVFCKIIKWETCSAVQLHRCSFWICRKLIFFNQIDLFLFSFSRNRARKLLGNIKTSLGTRSLKIVLFFSSLLRTKLRAQGLRLRYWRWNFNQHRHDKWILKGLGLKENSHEKERENIKT